MMTWTNERVDRAIAILRRHTDVAAARAEMSRAFGFNITSDSLTGAIRRRGSAPRDHLGADLVQSEDEAPTERRQPVAPISPPGEVDMVTALVEATKAGRTLDAEEACDLLGVSPRVLREVIEAAKAHGYTIDLAAGKVGRRPASSRQDTATVPIQRAGDTRVFAVASDIHVGSKFFLRHEFQDFVHIAYERGVRTILCPGDILDGVYKHSQWEEYAHGFDAQAEDAAVAFPRLDGLQYVGIAGNHDETHAKDSGLDPSRALEDVFRRHGRHDLTMLGSRGATVQLLAEGDARGLLVEMWHPLGGGAYALSYKLQRRIEGYALGRKPDVLLAGHWHQQCYFVQRGVHALSCGTWHGGQSPFGRALGTAPAIGGWIIEYAQTEDGTVRHFRPEWVAYYEHEAPRSVAV